MKPSIPPARRAALLRVRGRGAPRVPSAIAAALALLLAGAAKAEPVEAPAATPEQEWGTAFQSTSPAETRSSCSSRPAVKS